MALAAAPPAAQSQAVHGSGTTNQVPLWTSSNTLGNSALSQSGGNLTTSGNIHLSTAPTEYTPPTHEFGALQPNTPGDETTPSGFYALSSNTPGSGNPASGYQALLGNTTGHDNTASGASALSSNTTGVFNT